MKNRIFKTAALALGICLAFVSCNKDDGGDDHTFSWSSVFVPSDLNSKTPAAVYTGSYKDGSTAQGFKESGTYAIIFYSDGTFVETYKGFYTNTNTMQSQPVEKGVWKGTYSMVSGDFTNGDFDITIKEQWNSEINDWSSTYQTGNVKLRITDGSFKLEGVSFNQQNIGNNNGGNSGDNGATAGGVAGYTYKSNNFETTILGQTYQLYIKLSFTSTTAVTYYCTYVGHEGEPGYESELPGTYTISGNSMTVKLTDDMGTTMSFTTKDNWVTFTNEANLTLSRESGGNNQGGYQGNNGGTSTNNNVPSDLYLPDDFASKSVVAIYESPFDEDQVSLRNIGKYAIFLFSDGTWLETKKGVQYTYDANGNEISTDLNQNWSQGNYSLTGDYTNGNITLNMTQAWIPGVNPYWTSFSYSENIAVTSGTFYYDRDGDTFSLVSGTNNGGNNQGGNNGGQQEGGNGGLGNVYIAPDDFYTSILSGKSFVCNTDDSYVTFAAQGNSWAFYYVENGQLEDTGTGRYKVEGMKVTVTHDSEEGSFEFQLYQNGSTYYFYDEEEIYTEGTPKHQY